MAIAEDTQIAYVLNELKMSVNVLQLGVTGEIVASMAEVDYDLGGVFQVHTNNIRKPVYIITLFCS